MSEPLCEMGGPAGTAGGGGVGKRGEGAMRRWEEREEGRRCERGTGSRGEWCALCFSSRGARLARLAGLGSPPLLWRRAARCPLHLQLRVGRSLAAFQRITSALAGLGGDLAAVGRLGGGLEAVPAGLHAANAASACPPTSDAAILPPSLSICPSWRQTQTQMHIESLSASALVGLLTRVERLRFLAHENTSGHARPARWRRT